MIQKLKGQFTRILLELGNFRGLSGFLEDFRGFFRDFLGFIGDIFGTRQNVRNFKMINFNKSTTQIAQCIAYVSHLS